MKEHTNGRAPVNVGDDPEAVGPMYNRLIITGLLTEFRQETAPLKELIERMESLLDDFREDEKHLGDGAQFMTEITLLRRMLLQKVVELSGREAKLMEVLRRFTEGGEV